MTAPTMPDVLRLAADRLPAPTLADVRIAIHTVADPTAGPAFADCVFDAFERYEADAGWPLFRTVDAMAAHLRTLATALDAELARAARRHAAHRCTSCGGPATSILCNACYWEIVDASRRPAPAETTPGSAR